MKRARRMPIFSKIAPILATGFGFVAFAMVVPSNTSSKPEARIFTQGLSIQIDRSSPAYAALEDTLSSDTQNSVAVRAEAEQAELIQAAPVKPLLSGVTVSEPAAFKIERATRREEALLAQERERRLLNSQALVAALSRALPQVSHSSGALAATRATDSNLSSSDIEQVQAAGGTVISNGRIVTTNTVVTPVKSISAKDLAEFFGPLIKPAGPARVYPLIANSNVPRIVIPHIQNGLAALDTSSRVVQKDAPLDNANANVHQVVISGPVQFAGGIAITSSNDRIVIYRELDEEKLEPAQVWLKDAKYEVFVDQPVGRLVGELRSISGDVLGRGTFDLSALPKLEPNTYRIEKISMTIGPVPQGISGTVTTPPLASDANPKARIGPVKDAHIQLAQLPFDTSSKKDGTFKDGNLIEGSTVIVHADRPGHWGSLSYASAGTPVQLPMFSDAAVRAVMLAATGSDHENERGTSIIWGRISRGGVPIAGAHADLMTSETQPVYFNKMLLPDPTLKATTENGLYAFFPVEPGSHAVQAADEAHNVTEPSLIPTDQQTTTQVNLELKISKSAKIRVYDAFKTDWPLAAEVMSAGRKRGALVPSTGETTVTFTGGEGLLVLDADAGSSYDRIRTTVSKTKRKIDIPMVQTNWIDRIKGAMRINADPHAGTIVGFIRGTPAYQISLENESLGANTKILYFDARGEMTSKNYGDGGGGFLMFNVPQGFRTILIQPSGTTKALATAVLVEDRVTNVINKTF